MTFEKSPRNSLRGNLNNLEVQKKKLQARFFNSNILGQVGRFKTKEEVDLLRKEATKPFKSKKLKATF